MTGLHARCVTALRLAAVAVALAACGADEPRAPTAPPTGDSAAAPAMRDAASTEPDPHEASGVYDVHGVTVTAADGRLRQIKGVVRIHVKGETFSSTYELETTFPGPQEGVPATIAGWGQGMVVGDTMAGTISSSVVPRDPSLAATLPEQELHVMSSSVARLTPAGRLQMELQNHPGLEQVYSPTVTVLEGKRVGPLPYGAGIEPPRS